MSLEEAAVINPTDNTQDALQPIDWKLCLKLANGKDTLAEELLEILIKELPQIRAAILRACANRDLLALQRYVHKLHGAACYCGVPYIKTAAKKLETTIRSSNIGPIIDLTKELAAQIQQTLKCYKQGEYRSDSS